MNNETENAHLDKLVNDLFRLGDYSSWNAPKQDENVTWYSKKGLKYDHGPSVAERLEELIKMGANVKEKAYFISNINRPEPLAVAIKYGADPNLAGKNGILPIDRALDRGRTKIAEILVNAEGFNFKSNQYSNALFLSIVNGKYKLANDICKVNPSLILAKNSTDNTVVFALAEHLGRGTNKINSKVLTLLNTILDFAETQNYYFSMGESKGNMTIANQSPEMATMITERYALKLSEELCNKEENFTSKKNKI